MTQKEKELLDTTTSTANSTIQIQANNRVIVELDPDHPGFRDKEYRKRRNEIAKIATEYVSGTPIPDAPYTEEEHRGWEIICNHIEPAHQKYACKEFLDFKNKLDLPTNRIPQLREVSQKVEQLSGFRLEPVAGLVLPKVFLENLGENIFLSTQYIRHHSTPLYTPEPDVVHELIGHAAMLANPLFAELNQEIGKAAKRTPDPVELDTLGRVYWYTIEFGVLKEQGALKAYGAGLLSSAGELEAMSKVALKPLDFREMLALPYDVTQFQPVLFCADSFEQMHSSLKEFFRSWKA